MKIAVTTKKTKVCFDHCLAHLKTSNTNFTLFLKLYIFKPNFYCTRLSPFSRNVTIGQCQLRK